tara:strand:- start:646 stop:849 length:204 start_codon:yes stop_codon:yes gene_type:complete
LSRLGNVNQSTRASNCALKSAASVPASNVISHVSDVLLNQLYIHIASENQSHPQASIIVSNKLSAFV